VKTVADYPEEEEVDIAEIAVVQPVAPIRQKKEPLEKPKPKATHGSLTVKIASTSDRVTSVVLNCEGATDKQNTSSNSATFSSVPMGATCTLKFNPGGATYKGQLAGKSLNCSITNGNSISCK
jgi:hypothetical protein